MTGGDGAQLGYRVDPSVKRQWERYVAAAYGEYQGAKGEAIEDAMRRQIGADPVLEQLHNLADALDVEKVRKTDGAIADGLYAAPEGKNPGDVERRQQAVIDWILDAAEDGRLHEDDRGPVIPRKLLVNRIKEVAGVKSDKTVDQYVRDIASRSMFRRHPDQPEAWLIEP